MCPYTFIYREQEMHEILEAMTTLNVYSYLLVCNNKWLRVLPSLKFKKTVVVIGFRPVHKLTFTYGFADQYSKNTP